MADERAIDIRIEALNISARRWAGLSGHGAIATPEALIRFADKIRHYIETGEVPNHNGNGR